MDGHTESERGSEIDRYVEQDVWPIEIHRERASKRDADRLDGRSVVVVVVNTSRYGGGRIISKFIRHRRLHKT